MARGNIDFDQIQDAVRKGNGSQFQMFGGGSRPCLSGGTRRPTTKGNMANLIKRYRRVMAVGCTHGDLVHPQARADVLAFKKRFKPEIRFDLGDLIDTACFRAGAPGTKDEAKSPRDDHAAAIKWLQEFAPTHLAFGNHDWRLAELQNHPKAIISELSRRMWNEIQDEAKKLKAVTVPYDIEHGWIYLGGVAWGHGYPYNQTALRDHAEMLGCPVVMAHLHAPHQVEGRTVKDTPSFCVGALVDEEQLTYGRRRRASLLHGPGIVYGEVSDDKAYLWLIRGVNGEPLRIPPSI